MSEDERGSYAGTDDHFRVTFEEAPVGIAHTGLDGQWLRVNRRLAEILGYSRKELLDRTFQEVTHPDDLDADLRNLRLLLDGRVDRYSMEKRYVRKDGATVWGDLTVSLVRDEEGEPAYLIGVLVDITEQKQAERARRQVEEELLRAKEAAEEASRAKSDFLTVMSHELRTPLTAVVGYAGLLDAEVSGPINQEQREHIERIQLNAREQLDMIEEILTYSRMESGREVPVCQLTDLVEVAGDTARAVARRGLEKGLEFRTDLPAGPLRVETDPDKVRRVLFNLLTNAIRYTPKGEVCFRMEVGENEVTFEVEDTGIGIAAEHREDIFAPFWQTEQTLTREFGGSGLGLTVARRLSRMLGGEVSVESEVDVGSTFTFRLPVEHHGQKGE